MTERRGHSDPLEQVRRLLYPDLPPDEGRARIEAAIAGAGDEERWQRIEEIAAQSDLDAELLEELRSRRADRPGGD